jgi:hypothetical protein
VGLEEVILNNNESREDMMNELDKICMNCNNFFLYLANGPSEYGICVNDAEFEPYLKELFEKGNYDCCRKLIEKKKFDGNREPCKNFDMFEVAGDDVIDISAASGDQKISEVFDFIIKHKSVKKYRKQLNNPDRKKQIEAFESLVALALLENEKASELLIKSFKEIPPPITLEDTHFKIDVFRHVRKKFDLPDLIQVLERDLFEMKVNNHTRQWMTEIFKFLSIYREDDQVIELLTNMLDDKRFSYKIKDKIRKLLYKEDHFYFD